MEDLAVTGKVWLARSIRFICALCYFAERTDRLRDNHHGQFTYDPGQPRFAPYVMQ
jgi:hypothetical protein